MAQFILINCDANHHLKLRENLLERKALKINLVFHSLQSRSLAHSAMYLPLSSVSCCTTKLQAVSTCFSLPYLVFGGSDTSDSVHVFFTCKSKGFPQLLSLETQLPRLPFTHLRRLKWMQLCSP